jgi:twinkle protein
VRYLAKSVGCGWVVLDHLSIVVSGLGDDDERRLIDNAMTSLRTLVEETGIGLILVSHLKRPQGNKGHEEGAVTSLSQLRGSHAIAQLSDAVIGLERDQQSETPDVTTVRVLKNRFSGQTGPAGLLAYNHATGRLFEVSEDFEPEDDSPF